MEDRAIGALIRILVCRGALVVAACLPALPAAASHLSEKEVATMERACEDMRRQRLAPEREAAIEHCVRDGEGDRARCTERYGNYGERETGAIRKLGKYYDLPECVEAHRARKHYKLNPGR